ncbi:MAG TPA: ABC transporter ATP-binding protein [Gemmatimonadaceae bacterium]|nr:ABC transporter ATP-binding protein [Gemmatimonadaceae bacterium]
MPGASRLSLDALTRRFRDKLAVDALSLEIASGELVALMGASGSGKTTTLRMVAGYEPPDSGRVWLEGTDITNRAPRVRGFGMVFQHYALFPHMSVGENIAFGLEARGVAKKERSARAAAALANVGLAGAAPRAIQSLSGGEQQRVALARALVIEPPVLLLDEPLSNLDPNLRRTTRNELRAMLRRLGLTALFVTHDQEDAFAVADRVALMDSGRLLQVGAPEELHDNPVSRAVAEFIGRATFVPGTFDGKNVTVRIAGTPTTLAARAPASLGDARDVLAVLRPDSLALAPEGAGWGGVVTDRRFAGTQLVYRVRVDDATEVELQSTNRDVREGDRVAVRVVREPVPVVAV